MKKIIWLSLLVAVVFFAGCATAYKAQPVSFRQPSSYPNMQIAGGVQIAAKAYYNPEEAKVAFGFDIIGSGMLPVQIIFDNQGYHPIEVVPDQTFITDASGNMWQILTNKEAYDRSTKYAHTNEILSEGAQKGLLGAIAGSVVGAAIGIVSGGGVGEGIGKGAAVGAAAGAVFGGASAASGDDARQSVSTDMREKSLQNKSILPGNMAHGFLFFPAEAVSAHQLRLQVIEKDTGVFYVLNLGL